MNNIWDELEKAGFQKTYIAEYLPLGISRLYSFTSGSVLAPRRVINSCCMLLDINSKGDFSNLDRLIKKYTPKET